MDGWQNGIQKILHGQLQTGRIDAGMAAEGVGSKQFFIDQQLHSVIGIVHHPQHTEGAGCDVQKFLHIRPVSEGLSGGTYFLTEDSGFEHLVSGQHQQIEGSFLPVAQQQVFTDGSA